MTLHFEYDFEATKAALLYLAAQRLPNFDKYRALKLLFLADREHLLRFGRTVTGDSYSALPFGPTPDATHKLLDDLESVTVKGNDTDDPQVLELVRSLAVREVPYPEYEPQEAPDLDVLSESDRMVLDQVAAEHGHKTSQELKDLTHDMAAYRRAWRKNPCQRKLPMRFEDFFAETPDRMAFLKEIQEHQFLSEVFPS